MCCANIHLFIQNVICKMGQYKPVGLFELSRIKYCIVGFSTHNRGELFEITLKKLSSRELLNLMLI